MQRRSKQRALVAPVALLALLAVSCGGSDEGGDAASSPEEFCSRLQQFQDTFANEEADPETMAEFAALADDAPDEDLRTALQQMEQIAEEVSGVDENDPDAMAAMLELAFSPDVVAATETIDDYGVENCGFEASFTADESTSNDDGTPAGAADGGDSSGAGTAMSDLDTTELAEAFRDALEESDVSENGVGVSMLNGEESVLVSFEVNTSDDVDGVALCDAVAAIVEAGTEDPEVAVELLVNSEVVSQRLLGESNCVSV
ncbi:hypothetical protein [Rhabdothermincola salaria]|uniref:hypothetical protein n=1 Tax=Rhabdothermincola salaria TaxID=2903142 RepID=UPI001E4E47E9|nr:hypothetical protein [Rhabdothermincola salaria]MCD9622361.1 hypothetical protein [Rhabdothermincola salaria]